MNHSTCIARTFLVILTVMFAVGLSFAPRVLADNGDAATVGEPPVDLRPMWETGQTSKFKTITRRTTIAQVRGVGQPRTSIMDVTSETTWKVVEANPDGGGRCVMTINDMQVLVTNAAGDKRTATKDRADDELQPIQQLLRAMIDKPVTVMVDASGRVTSAAGWQEIRNAAGDAGKNLTENDFMESASELALLAGGSSNADVGAQWTQNFNWDHEMGAIHIDAKYNVTGIESIADIGLVTVEQESAMRFTPDASKLPNQGPSVSIRMLRGAEKASIMYDLSRHEAVGRDLNRAMVFQMDIEHEGRQFQQLIQQQLRTQVLRMDETIANQ